MIARLLAAGLLLLASGLAFAAPERTPAAPAVDDMQLERQLLVTFRTPPGHARSAASYRKSPGRSGAPERARQDAEKVASQNGLRLLDGWPMPSLGVDCFVMQLAPGQSREQVVATLAGDPRVESAQPMQAFRVLGVVDPLLPTQPAAAPWHLRELHAVATGKNILVAQVDTGVDVRHPDLRGRIGEARNFVPGQSFVAEQHGTAVAGILAARADDGVGIAGIAPGVRLLALRGCWQQADGGARCSSYSLAQALQYALVARAQLINLSLTGPQDPLLARLLDVALRNRVAVVAAIDAGSADGGFPASHAGVIAVAADDEAPALAGAILAPGRGVPATNTSGGWDLVSGASFATAEVSGVVALLLELSPALSPPELHALLLPPRAGEDRRLDACAALERGGARCACGCGAPVRARLSARPQ